MPKGEEPYGFSIEPLQSNPFADALETGRLDEAIQLAWLAIESGRTCGREVRFLAELLAAYEDEEGLAFLRQKAQQRADRDPRYQPPFAQRFDDGGNVNLLAL